jgi:hypothetical protein
MKTIVLVIGIATAVLGCATTDVRDDQLWRARGASYCSAVCAPVTARYHPGAITVNPGQVFEN